MTRAAGGTFTVKTEEEVLVAIKCLAVREENAMVEKVMLHEIREDSNEHIRSFDARVRGQAVSCKYLLNCDCGREISYSEHNLQDIVVPGLVD